MKAAYMNIMIFVLMAGFVAAVNDGKGGYNPTCQDLGYENGIKIDPPASGEYDGITFVLEDNGQYFDWSSQFPIDAVVAKGGPNATIYYYTPGSFADTHLVSPINEGGQVPQLSHAQFCWNNEIPEFGVIAGATALLGAIGILVYRRMNA